MIVFDTKSARDPPLFILLLLVSFASVFAVLFTPALPAIALSMGVSDSTAQMTMTAFLVGYALGFLPYGPIANRYGRKPALYLGASLAIFGALLAIVAGAIQAFWLLVFSRFLMALGSCVGMKIAYTMVADSCTPEQTTKRMARFVLAFAICPGLSVAIGGLLTQYFGWESCFYFLVAYGLLLLILARSLPETLRQRDLAALVPSRIAAAYLASLKNRQLVAAALLMGCGSAIIYLFASEAPFIGMEKIGLSPKNYGLLNFIPLLGMVGGSFLSHSLSGKRDLYQVILIGLLFALVPMMAMLLLFALGILTPWSLFLPMPFLYFGETLAFSNVSALAMSRATDKSNASAILNCINMSIAVSALLIFEMLPDHHPVYMMPVVFLFFGGMMLLLRQRLVNVSR